MGISIMTKNGELQIPTRGGGTSVELLARIALLEQKVQDLQDAVPNKLDAGKVTMATGVTQAGFAADARMMNPALEGTLGYGLQGIKDSISFGQNMYRRVEHFDSEENYYIFDEGFICRKNGIAIVHFNYVIARNVIGSDPGALVLSGMPVPQAGGGRWFSAASNDSVSHVLNFLVLPEGTLKIYGGTKDSGYRVNFSYPCM